MKMNRISFFALLSVLWLVVAGLAGDIREPIVILGNSDFIVENGVVSGSGTVEDPYIIAGWEINVPEGVAYGVKVENVSAHFILRGLVIRGAMNADGAAIRLGFVSAATVENCAIASSLNGIEIASSTGVIMRSNILSVMGRGLRVTGESAAEFAHTIDRSNILNGHPILYLYGRDGETISGIDSNNLYIVASRNMTITGNRIANGDGIQLAFVEDSIISENAVYRTTPLPTGHGISLYRSSGNRVITNLLKNNRYAGIHLWLSSENVIAGNSLLANNQGLIIAASDDNRVEGNTIYANPIGIEVSAGSTGNLLVGNIIAHENTKQGISIEKATGNRVEENVIIEAEIGIILGVLGNNNTVIRNTVVQAAFGMLITGSNNKVAWNLLSQSVRGILFPETFGEQIVRGNVLHGNVFTDNRHHLHLNKDSVMNHLSRNAFFGRGREIVTDRGTKNSWTVGGEGNYWADYQGEDADGDGIGDDPVLILPSGRIDTAPFISSEAARTGVGVLSALELIEYIVLTAEGEEVRISALLATARHEQFVGFRGFPAELIADFPGIMFAYEDEAVRHFTMATVLFPLDIAFFDSEGAFIGSTTMAADSPDLYTVDSPFKYALELPSGTLAELGIGLGARLLLPEDD